MTSINASTTVKLKKKVLSPPISRTSSTNSLPGLSRNGVSKPRPRSPKPPPSSASQARGQAPTLRPSVLSTEAVIAAFKLLPPLEQKEQVTNFLREAFGERKFMDRTSKPHTSSQTSDRGSAAADVAMAAQSIGVSRVLKKFGVLVDIERTLFPNGIGSVFASADGGSSGMTRIVSTASLASLVSINSDVSAGTGITSEGGNDKRKTTPPNCREGALLILRALCDVAVPKKALVEPYVVPMFAAVLDECGASQSNVREAAEDTSRSIIRLANPHAVSVMIFPVILVALKSPEWRVKFSALERLSQLSTTASQQICRLIPKIIPSVTEQVWDTKPQVSKAAAHCLMATAQTTTNPDVRPAIPAVVKAIIKPSETVKAVEELMGTTFVATVDASTLALLCPVLARGLKEKIALHKRACCIVIENMSRLVETPDAVAPFGPLLVPELKKVAENVQFEEIRDAALAALKALTKALGHSSIDDAVAAIMAEEAKAIEEEQRRIEEERTAELAREEEIKRKEDEERKLWKEAMEAQRLLDQIAEREEEEKKAEELRKKELIKKSTKSEGGKCKGCGLKKCRKDCLFADT